MQFYTYRHGQVRHIGLRGLGELMLISNDGRYGVGFALRPRWRTRYVFWGRGKGFNFIG